MIETFVLNLVFPNCPSLQILGKTQTGVFPNSRFLVKSIIKENCHNSRTSDDIDMKLGPITKLYKRNKTTSKNFDEIRHARKLWRHCHFFNLWPIWSNPGSSSRRRVCKLMFSLKVTFYLTKTENRTKKSLTHLSHYCFE